MNKSIMRSITLVIMMTAGSILSAQPPGGGGGSGTGGPPPAGLASAPIDSGAIVLLAGVAGYSYSQLRRRRK